jgi:hypothetical protein
MMNPESGTTTAPLQLVTAAVLREVKVEAFCSMPQGMASYQSRIAILQPTIK